MIEKNEFEEEKTPFENETDNALHFQNRLAVEKIITGVNSIKQQLNKVIIGQDEFIDLLLLSLIANGNCLIEGVPGIAKTVTAKLLAKTMDFGFSRIQFTPDLMPSDILGTAVYNNKIGDFEYKKGPIYSNIILIDEINRAPAKTQAALFEVMAERQITMDGVTYQMENPFIVFATQNPIEQEGTYRLPEAQLDRFLFKIEVDYPSLEDEVAIIHSFNDRKEKNIESEIRAVLSAKDIIELQQMALQVNIEKNLIRYIAQIVNNTRQNPYLFLGASPRASLSILVAAKAKAAISGRDFIIPEDIKYVAAPALRHRIIVNPEKEMEGISADFVIKQIVDGIEIPR